MTTGYGVAPGRVRGVPRRAWWIAGSTVALLALVALIGVPLLRSGDGWSAWTVRSHPDGSATLLIRDLREASGLEWLLGEEGVPAHVTFAPEGVRCAPGTGPSDVDASAVSVSYREEGIAVHIGRMPAGHRLSLAGFQLVGGDVRVEAAVVPLDRGRCVLVPL